ncbi:hypothetical protein GCM10009802_32870 [Streptomyces synnematoformans]|uniref:Uncharacterized protein n=1 Tax=Streptomyces synnematoformans TaxID=415721 RepID=A0ABN2YG68_9ACTN
MQYTAASMWTPSNSAEIRLPASAAGTVKAYRYQPRPPGRYPVPPPVSYSVVGVNSMLQSCGTATRRQPLSSWSGSAAPAYGPVLSSVPPSGLTRANRQPSRRGTTSRPPAAPARAVPTTAAAPPRYGRRGAVGLRKRCAMDRLPGGLHKHWLGSPV